MELQNEGQQGTDESAILNEETVVESVDQSQQSDNEVNSDEGYDWGGRKLSAQELYDESRKLQSDYTRKSQRLSELEREREAFAQPKEVDPTANFTPEEKAQYEQVASNLSPFLKKQLDEAISQRVQQEIQQGFSQQEQRRMYEQKFSEVQKIAKEAGIKYDQQALLDTMNRTGNADVESAFRNMYYNQMIDYEVKKRGEKKKPIYSQSGGTAKSIDSTATPKYEKGTQDPNFIRDTAATLRNLLRGN